MEIGARITEELMEAICPPEIVKQCAEQIKQLRKMTKVLLPFARDNMPAPANSMEYIGHLYTQLLINIGECVSFFGNCSALPNSINFYKKNVNDSISSKVENKSSNNASLIVNNDAETVNIDLNSVVSNSITNFDSKVEAISCVNKIENVNERNVNNSDKNINDSNVNDKNSIVNDNENIISNPENINVNNDVKLTTAASSIIKNVDHSTPSTSKGVIIDNSDIFKVPKQPPMHEGAARPNTTTCDRERLNDNSRATRAPKRARPHLYVISDTETDNDIGFSKQKNRKKKFNKKIKKSDISNNEISDINTDNRYDSLESDVDADMNIAPHIPSSLNGNTKEIPKPPAVIVSTQMKTIEFLKYINSKIF